jgi:4'-phosphopantetheinyl transferase
MNTHICYIAYEPTNEKDSAHDSAYRLLYRLTGRYLSMTETEAQEYISDRVLINEKGKPYLPQNEFYFNISHCKDYVAAAVCDIPVGIDIEAERIVKDNVVVRVLSLMELDQIEEFSDQMRILAFWTLKESFYKRTGTGLVSTMNETDFVLPKQLDGAWQQAQSEYCDGIQYVSMPDRTHVISLSLEEDASIALL